MPEDLYEKTKARLARETGAVAVRRAAGVRFALAFPNVYGVGMASLGYQLVHQMLNGLPNASCERVFLPDDDDLSEHIRSHTELFTLESQHPLSEFDVVAFSVSFEMDYLNVLHMLKLANVPLGRDERGESNPLVIAGGACPTFNPEPLADFVDAFVIGDSEDVLPELVNAIESAQGKPREEMLAALAGVAGVYVPAFYQPEYAEGGELIAMQADAPAPRAVSRAVCTDLADHPAESCIGADDAEFGDITLVEIARGCGRKCRFCVAGHITRPPRVRHPEGIARPAEHASRSAEHASRHPELDSGSAHASEEMLKQVQHDAMPPRSSRLGLVGAAVFDHPEAQEICRSIVERGGEFTVSSVRLETVTPELAALMAAGGQKTLTIAPEAGSERLRCAINKNAPEEAIFAAVSAAREAGISRVKLYFMIGLPTETDSDIAAIVDLVRRLAGEFPSVAFQVSASSFVPKPWTPFQWHPMERENTLKKRLAILKKGLTTMRGVKLGGESPRLAVVQGYLARGDRRMGAVLRAALEDGGDYSAALRASGVDARWYLHRQRERAEALPWDHIDAGIDKDYLWEEYRRSLRGETTAPCAVGKCTACGACGGSDAHS